MTDTLGGAMNKSFKTVLELDFYGNLLTPRMRDLLEMYIFDDLSLGEIADSEGISRQGVHDSIKRAIKQLDEYEAKLQLIERFKKERSYIDEIIKLLDSGDIDAAKSTLINLREQVLSDTEGQ